jgi:hypothetical protein
VTSTRSLRAPGPDLGHEVVDLALGGLDDDLGVDQAGGADDLLDDAVPRRWLGQLVVARRRRQVDGLADALDELLERSGRLSIALGSRKPCSTSIRLRDWSPSYMPRSAAR